MDKSASRSIRFGAVAAIIGGAATAISGALVQAVVQPASTVPDTMWSYPWSAATLVTVSLLYAVFHLLVFLGMHAFARSRVAGTTRSARAGTALVLVGTASLFVAELATIPFRHQRLDDTGPALVGAVFGLGTVLTAVGLLLAGTAVLRAGRWHGWRRFVPLTAGIWITVLVAMSFTSALPLGVGIYGAFVLVLGVALYTQPTSGSVVVPRPVTRATVVN